MSQIIKEKKMRKETKRMEEKNIRNMQNTDNKKLVKKKMPVKKDCK